MSRNKSKERVMVKFSFALLPEEKLKVEQYAKAMNISPSEFAREAVRDFIYNLEKPQEAIRIEETELAHRVRKMEDRMAALLAKLTRAAAQGLYFSTLPYMYGGLPTEPLPEGAMKKLWYDSRMFAGNYLKKVHTNPTNEDGVSGSINTEKEEGELKEIGEPEAEGDAA
ncbi:MAG: hypothetical protein IPJ49_29285 [Candidatus Obscuribacter sp.]|nr:hypothetical protein [Candidatus Obscuribacter sp.]